MSNDFEWIRGKANFDILDREANDLIVIRNTGNLSEDFYKYACDFQEAADLSMSYLANEASPGGMIGYLDTWFFAITYLYRQSLELMVKALMFKVCSNDDMKMVIGEVRHDLQMCFQKVNECVQLEDSSWEWLRKFMEDITKTDKESDMFRYPFSVKMKSFFEEQQGANIHVIKQNMNIAFEILKDIFEGNNIEEKSYSVYEPKLLIDAGGYYDRSVFGYKYTLRSAYGPYVKSYIETAEFLRTKMKENAYQNKQMFMPMCYLYRNAVELSLKRILMEDLAIGYNEKEKVLIKKKHSVQGLWNSIEPEVIKEAGPNDDPKTIENARCYIEQLHSIDGESTRFRYPVDKKLNLYFKNTKRYNVNNVAKCFNELCNFLDGVDGMMSAHREWEAEMRSEMLAEMQYEYY